MVEQVAASASGTSASSLSTLATREQDRRLYVLGRARELAATGRYMDWRRIEARLIVDGYTQARSVIADPMVRAELDRLCGPVFASPRRATPHD